MASRKNVERVKELVAVDAMKDYLVVDRVDSDLEHRALKEMGEKKRQLAEELSKLRPEEFVEAYTQYLIEKGQKTSREGIRTGIVMLYGLPESFIPASYSEFARLYPEEVQDLASESKKEFDEVMDLANQLLDPIEAVRGEPYIDLSDRKYRTFTVSMPDGDYIVQLTSSNKRVLSYVYGDDFSSVEVKGPKLARVKLSRRIVGVPMDMGDGIKEYNGLRESWSEIEYFNQASNSQEMIKKLQDMAFIRTILERAS